MVAMILLKLDAFSGTRHLTIVPRRSVAMLHALIFAQLATTLLQLSTYGTWEKLAQRFGRLKGSHIFRRVLKASTNKHEGKLGS